MDLNDMSTELWPGNRFASDNKTRRKPVEIVSFSRKGYAGELVKVEADLRRGIPAVDIVGLPDGAVKEARERVRAAIRNSGLEYPRERILINLSPANLRKEGSAFDLAIALAVLASAKGLAHGGIAGRVLILGELELSGFVRPVSGVLAAVSRALEDGVTDCIIPAGNRAEAALMKEASVIAVDRLADAMAALEAIASGERIVADEDDNDAGNRENGATTGGRQNGADGRLGTGSRDGIARVPGTEPREASVRWEAIPAGDAPFEGYEDVRGQGTLVRALQIAAAGGHHLIAYGPPGVGKTLALRRFPSILPALDEETAIEVTRIHGIAGPIAAQEGSSVLIERPPFREPHQNASLEGMIGGGRLCGPGEISLAHGGTLFLDEATQFRPGALQALRTPLETGWVTVSRAGVTGTFPARFQLLAAINPCPCGNFGAEGRVCTCDPEVIERYWRKLTVPLLDRIDLRIQVALPDPESLTRADADPGFSTKELREGIGRARLAQEARHGRAGRLNARMGPSEIGAHCALSPALAKTFASGLTVARLSGRSAHIALKVARTIADIAGARSIEKEHLFEALALRRWSATVPDFLKDG
jgi:magnesium chelatase family protein